VVALRKLENFENKLVELKPLFGRTANPKFGVFQCTNNVWHHGPPLKQNRERCHSLATRQEYAGSKNIFVLSLFLTM